MNQPTKKKITLAVKAAILVAVLGFVGWVVFKAWRDVQDETHKAHIHLTWSTIDWRFGVLAVLGFCGVMLTSALAWRWLAWKMGDRSPASRILGAYTFSQMGKYVPGKVALLLMRIDRAGRFGMTARICTLSTLLENALYMISGALVGMFAIAHVADQLSPKIRPFLWPVVIAAAAGLAAVCHPSVFYRLVNTLLKRMKKVPVAPEDRLKTSTLAIGALAFLPCWIFGGFALWASACSLHWIPPEHCLWFAGAFSLSVIVGMASLFPGGAGIREAVLGAAVGLQLAPTLGHDQAILIGALAAIMQRVFQLIAEFMLGIVGAMVTHAPPKTTP